jgi:hypothetical protein
MAPQADRDGLDMFSLSDHPSIGGRLDAYASVGFVLGSTQRLAGFANVTGAVLEHGAAGFMLFSPEGGTPDIVSLTRRAREIVPAVREMIANGKN